LQRGERGLDALALAFSDQARQHLPELRVLGARVDVLPTVGLEECGLDRPGLGRFDRAAALRREVSCVGFGLGLQDAPARWIDRHDRAPEAAAQDSKSGTLGGKYLLYGLNSKGSTGAQLRYSQDREFNSVVPAQVIAELETLKKKFAANELKVPVTREDARGGI
jgi:hypothetical protein